MRARCATLTLLALTTVPVAATIWIGSKNTNLLCTILVVLFCGLMSPEIAASVRRVRDEPPVRLLALGAAGCVLAWVVLGHPFLTESRFWLYVGLVAFVPAFGAWLRQRPDGLRWVLLAKLLVTALALGLVAHALAVAPGERAVVQEMPIYRNVRHLNYDLTVLVVLVGYLATVVVRRWEQVALVTAFGVLAYFTAWSGGRGQLLALGVLVVLLVAVGGGRPRGRRAWLLAAGLVAGLLAVPVTGRGRLLADQFGRSVGGDAGAVTSGRLHLWEVTLRHVVDSPGTLLFGHGPDAFDGMDLGTAVHLGARHELVHPHNVVVQWLLELGLVGTALALALCGWVGVRAFRVVRDEAGAPRVVGALLLGMFAYAMTDGVLFHAIPMTVVAGLVGYVVAGQRTRGVSRAAAAGTPPAHSPRAPAPARSS